MQSEFFRKIYIICLYVTMTGHCFWLNNNIPHPCLKLLCKGFYILCMQVFSSEGEFLLKFGSNGEGNGQFNAPTGVAVDNNSNIIVADWGNSRIQVGASGGTRPCRDKL